MELESKIYVAGHRGLVGSALVRELKRSGFGNLITRTSNEIDLRDRDAVMKFFISEKPEYVFLAAAKVGGIHANDTYPAEFIFDNLAIQLNVIDSARTSGVKKLLFLGSSCIYPRECPQPMREEFFLSGYLEKTNEPYAVAKIAGIIMCEAYRRQYGSVFISAMPTNLYGPGDNFDLKDSHVIPALIRRFHEGKVRGDAEVVVWGTGMPRREFLYADDLASALVFLMKEYDDSGFINVGSGEDISIRDLAELIRNVVGYAGRLTFDSTKPDGTPRKLLDVSRINS
ncbi:MAG: NAD-dependent epimerase/dehydratase family protein, partial [Deltaproteobacteria bacterium]|nr:NAD-dependent epimerase/dehydratase family protein [Deltaproteobacteria bacterium]NIS77818.1 NAD-dependent epimerase/dehydratase family protein [Deltaproteobacteria bacterium]